MTAPFHGIREQIQLSVIKLFKIKIICFSAQRLWTIKILLFLYFCKINIVSVFEGGTILTFLHELSYHIDWTFNFAGKTLKPLG